MSKSKILIIFALIISLFLAGFLSKEVFVSNSPKVNQKFIANLRNLPKNIFLALQNKPSSFSNNQANPVKVNLQDLKNISFKEVSKGVYAGEAGHIKYYKISQSEVDWQEIELKTNSGKVIKLRYPKDQPPAKEMLEIIKSE